MKIYSLVCKTCKDDFSPCAYSEDIYDSWIEFLDEHAKCNNFIIIDEDDLVKFKYDINFKL